MFLYILYLYKHSRFKTVLSLKMRKSNVSRWGFWEVRSTEDSFNKKEPRILLH